VVLDILDEKESHTACGGNDVVCNLMLLAKKKKVNSSKIVQVIVYLCLLQTLHNLQSNSIINVHLSNESKNTKLSALVG